MKRIIAIILSLLLLLSFVACGNNDESSSSTAESSIIENTFSENESFGESNIETSNESVSSGDVSEDISEDSSEELSEGSSEESSEESLSESSDEPNGESSSAAECAHRSTKLIGKITATCAKEGYTGDTFCLDCQTVVAYGETTEKSKTHGRTELVGYVEATATANGYSGDKVCSVCGETIEKGYTIPMVQNGSTFIDEFGNYVFVPAGEDVFDYTLNNAKDEIPDVDHPYVSIDVENPYFPDEYEHCEWDTLTVEKETFRLMNEERIKAGVAPLKWCEDAYYFAYTRAREQEKSWGHTRPNGKDFNHIFSEYDVFPGHCGENLYMVNAVPPSYEIYAVKSWVNSSGHYANMINEKYTRTVIAVYYSETTRCSYFVQLFFA